MSDISFEQDKNYKNYSYTSPAKKQGFITKLLIKLRLADNQEEASKIMVGILILFFALAIIIFFLGRNRNEIKNPGEDLINSPQPTGSLSR